MKLQPSPARSGSATPVIYPDPSCTHALPRELSACSQRKLRKYESKLFIAQRSAHMAKHIGEIERRIGAIYAAHGDAEHPLAVRFGSIEETQRVRALYEGGGSSADDAMGKGVSKIGVERVARKRQEDSGESSVRSWQGPRKKGASSLRKRGPPLAKGDNPPRSWNFRLSKSESWPRNWSPRFGKGDDSPQGWGPRQNKGENTLKGSSKAEPLEKLSGPWTTAEENDGDGDAV